MQAGGHTPSPQRAKDPPLAPLKSVHPVKHGQQQQQQQRSTALHLSDIFTIQVSPDGPIPELNNDQQKKLLDECISFVQKNFLIFVVDARTKMIRSNARPRIRDDVQKETFPSSMSQQQRSQTLSRRQTQGMNHVERLLETIKYKTPEGRLGPEVTHYDYNQIDYTTLPRPTFQHDQDALYYNKYFSTPFDLYTQLVSLYFTLRVFFTPKALGYKRPSLSEREQLDQTVNQWIQNFLMIHKTRCMDMIQQKSKRQGRKQSQVQVEVLQNWEYMKSDILYCLLYISWMGLLSLFGQREVDTRIKNMLTELTEIGNKITFLPELYMGQYRIRKRLLSHEQVQTVTFILIYFYLLIIYRISYQEYKACAETYIQDGKVHLVSILPREIIPDVPDDAELLSTSPRQGGAQQMTTIVKT